MINIKWTYEKLQEESLKYRTRTEFSIKSGWAYERAHKMGIFEEICAHMPRPGQESKRTKWTFEKMQQEALKYETKIEFKTKSNGAYSAALRRGILKDICSHMVELLHFWTKEEVLEEALKYHHRLEFQIKNKNAYNSATRMGILDRACHHMRTPDRKPRPLKWTLEMLLTEALKYTRRVDFMSYSATAYSTCVKRGILEQTCSHMKKSAISSFPERELMDAIKKIHSSAKTLNCRKIKIEGKPHIRGFDIDIFIPELNMGIEFDGEYYHSFVGLKRTRSHWPDEDLINYHQIKDDYFTSVGIKILHVKEEDYFLYKEACIKLCLEFLSKK